jgi:SAM-dependent methyltransferase
VYGPEFSELYDLLHAAKAYRSEALFIRDAVRELLPSGSRTLRLIDFACGTGTHAIQLSGMRFEVTGVDASAEMLAHARRKARKAKLKIRLEQQDLTTISFPGERWDVATCLFDSLGYLHTDARITRALRGIRRTLVPGGLFIVEVWHAPAMLGGFDPVRIRRVNAKGFEAVRISETRLIEKRRVAEVRYEVFSRKRNGPWHQFNETHVTRFFTQAEITELLEAAGFRVLRVSGGFDESNPTNDAWHLVIVAERPEGNG